MQTTIDLNAELRQWLSQRLSETLGDNPNNRHYLHFDIREANADIFYLLYDYQLMHQWPSIDAHTAAILCVERSTIWRRMTKK